MNHSQLTVSQRHLSRLCLAVVYLLSLTLLGSSAFALDDQTQTETTAPPQRIVTLSPHAAELVEFVGASERLVGVSLFTPFPASAQHVPAVADAHGLNAELLMALQPDLVIAWQQSLKPQQQAWLAAQNLRVFISNPTTLAELRAELAQLGALLGTEQQTALSLAAMDQAITALRALRPSDADVVQVVHVLWHQPLIVLTPASILVETLRLCGIDTPVSISGKATATLSAEALLAMQPDMLLVGQDWQQENGVMHGFPVLVIDTDQLHRPTPRMLDAALDLCQRLHQQVASERR